MIVQTILVIRFGGIGDIIMTTPAIRALARRFPCAAIDIVVGTGMDEAIAGHPCIRRVLTIDKKAVDSRPALMLPVLRELWRNKYDLVINFHPSVKSALIAIAARPRQFVWFRKRILDDSGNTIHAIDDFLQGLSHLGIGASSARSLEFAVPECARQSIARTLRAAGVGSSDQVLVINPAASRPINRWPAEHFRIVAGHFAALAGVKVVVTGAPSTFRSVSDGLDETYLAAEVASVDGRVINLAGQISVKEYGALLQRATAFLTCDTGPMHIGAALDTPMIVLAGAADPKRTGPLNANSHTLIDRSLECVPCRARTCARGDGACMSNLGTEDAIMRLTGLLAGSKETDYVKRLVVV